MKTLAVCQDWLMDTISTSAAMTGHFQDLWFRSLSIRFLDPIGTPLCHLSKIWGCSQIGIALPTAHPLAGAGKSGGRSIFLSIFVASLFPDRFSKEGKACLTPRAVHPHRVPMFQRCPISLSCIPLSWAGLRESKVGFLPQVAPSLWALLSILRALSSSALLP